MRASRRLFPALSFLACAGLASPTWGATCTEPLSALYEKVAPAVVSISATRINKNKLDRRFETVSGSGFMVEADGLALTNAHVVDGASSVVATLDSGQKVAARLLGVDTVLDVALLKLDVGKPQAVGRLGDSSAIRVGEEVVAIGNPIGFDQTMTRGIVSGINRVIPNTPGDEPMLQTDAPINPGNSGGPLVDRCGFIVGITTLVSYEAQNIGFAIPINSVKAVLRELRETGKVTRSWLGLQGRTMDPRLGTLLKMPLTPGFLVEVVEDGSPAERAGIRGGELSLTVQGEEFLLGGDIVTAVNGVPIRTQQDFSSRVKALKPGQRVRLTVFREGSTREVNLVAVERPRLPYDLAE
jgi:S1-C subfamily serine protease